MNSNDNINAKFYVCIIVSTQAKGFSIEAYTKDYKNDYISLTDIAKYKSNEPNDVIRNWMRGN